MDKQIYDQITNLIEKSQKILVLAHARVDCDGLGAALSAYLVLKELGKEVTVVTNDPAPENLHFLPSINTVQNSLAGTKDFIITIDASKTPVGKIKYNVEGDKVNIIITPKDGSFSESDVSFNKGKTDFDLIIVLDTGNLEHLGPIYDRNVEMFYETPVVNIDHHASNTDFGQVNMVDVNASSTTEILYEYLVYLEGKYNKKLITEDIATLLLAGIITDTGSFQHANTSPRAMESSAKLLDLGARQQEIVKNIFKTKKLSTLKLWGIILAKVQVDPVHRMVWSTISADDLQEAEADPEETEGIIDDLLTNAPGAEVIFLIKQSPDLVSISMRSTNNQADVGKFCAENGGGGHVRAAGFKIRDGRPFEEIVSEVIGKVRKFQAERLNIHEPIGAPIGAPMGAPIGDEQQKAKPQLEPRDEGAEPQSETKRSEEPQSEKVTYLDFKKPEQPIGAPMGAPMGAPIGDEQQKAKPQPAPQSDSDAPRPAPPTKSKKRRLRRKPKPVEEPMGAPVGAPIGAPIGEGQQQKQQPKPESTPPPPMTEAPPPESQPAPQSTSDAPRPEPPLEPETPPPVPPIEPV